MRKLLVADNSITIQRVVELTFADEDIQVLAVGDGEQAIARIPVEKPDIVLADIAMPKRNGYDVSAFVKNHRDLAHVPVLLLAGAFEPVDDRKARDVKSDGVIVKPFDPRQVVSRVRELLNPQPSPTTAPTPDAGGQFASLDEYFAHLDHALQTRPTTPPDVVEPLRRPDADPPMIIDVPTIESVLETYPTEPDRSGAANPVVDTRSEAKEPGRPPITDDVIDDITRRVLERLSTGPLRQVVSKVVREEVEQTLRHSQTPAPNPQRD